ncbi:TOBE domain-containing protein [Vogesella indigofera]|uniref:TOBE domain-containing protein n=1 Tax=Vogesella indigofera TaxID=45465 RepID=UPI00234E55C1|nr:TOBE domain-containing protein [Vogesella indigofera]MDC7700228.1 TOBE domain-containing protein [Vogesella indigofera]
MNRLPATIHALHSADGLHLLELTLCGQPCTAFASAALPPWQAGQTVEVLFRELDVALSTAPCPTLSIRNSLPCHIVAIRHGELFSDVTLHSAGATLHAVITRRSCDSLALHEGMTVYALIKSNALQLLEPAP